MPRVPLVRAATPRHPGFNTCVFPCELEHSAYWDCPHTPGGVRVPGLPALSRSCWSWVQEMGLSAQAHLMNLDSLVSSLSSVLRKRVCSACGAHILFCFILVLWFLPRGPLSIPTDVPLGPREFPAASPAFTPEHVLVLLLVDNPFSPVINICSDPFTGSRSCPCSLGVQSGLPREVLGLAQACRARDPAGPCLQTCLLGLPHINQTCKRRT